MKSKLFLFFSFLTLSFHAIAEESVGDVEKMGSPFGSGLIFLVIIVVMYFLMIRPQSKKAKEHRNLISKIKEGDEVITTGGIIGKVSKINDSFIQLSISDNVSITMQRQSIAAALPKGTMKSV